LTPARDNRLISDAKTAKLALQPTQSPIQWAMGSFSPEVMQPGQEVNHSHPSSAMVKKQWSYNSTPATWHGKEQLDHLQISTVGQQKISFLIQL